jgi:DNA-binding NarL/FixJ family response regulator
MNIVLFSKQDFLIKEIKKSSFIEDINIVKENLEIFDYLKSGGILLYHLDSNKDFQEDIKELLEDFQGIKIAVFRDNPNNIEGCSLLKKGIKAYAHSISNSLIINDIIKALENGKIWVYPELMQFLISSVPLENKKEKELLNKLSVKELEVLELLSQGLNNSKIAQTLDLAEVTVKKHISSLFKKLDKKDRLSLALFFKSTI